MDKRYQVFISSTFTDLVDERQHALKAVLELDHMPAGMELFPASDETAWQLIKGVIDASDYYLLIVGGRYGSMDEAGLGYTEKEYDYAYSLKRPVIALLHKNPNNLPRERTETDDAIWKKLEAFRKKVEQRHTCDYWESAEGLKAKIIVGVTAIVKRHPAVGWVRADKVPSDATVGEILSLKNRIAEMEEEAAISATAPPPGTEDLAQGSDNFEVHSSFTSRDPEETYPYPSDETWSWEETSTWNDIFATVAPTMIQEATDLDVREVMRKYFRRLLIRAIRRDRTRPPHKRSIEDLTISREDIETCLVQLRALGLISESLRKRSVRDTGKYWQLTPYGNRLMVQLRAIRRNGNPSAITDSPLADEQNSESTESN